MGSDLCILFCLQNGTLIRPASTRFVIDCSRTPVPRNRFVQVGAMEEAGSMEEADLVSQDIQRWMPCRFCLGPR
jgi:hypothetical protein